MLAPIREAQQGRPGGRSVVAPRFLPQLRRLHDGHQDLLAVDRVHLLANDLRDLAQHLPSQRQIRVDAGGELADEPGTDGQLVADHLRI